MDKIYRSNRQYSALFKIASECNDFCPFCLEYKFIKSGRPPLSFEEFKKNYYYLRKKFRPDYVILTGGEPTLHPRFFSMLDFLKRKGEAFRIITNLLKFSESGFLERLTPIFSGFKNKKQEKWSKIIASINNLPEKSATNRKRFAGLEKALKFNLPLMVTTVLYRGNIKNLPVLSEKLVNLFRKFNVCLSLEFRLIYIEGTLPSLLKISVPRNFPLLKKSLEESVEILYRANAGLTLWNFPLCYLDNPRKLANAKIKDRYKRRLIKVHKNAQLEKAEIRNWEEYLKTNRSCGRCRLNYACAGMDKDYIDKYKYPKLRPIP